MILFSCILSDAKALKKGQGLFESRDFEKDTNLLDATFWTFLSLFVSRSSVPWRSPVTTGFQIEIEKNRSSQQKMPILKRPLRPNLQEPADFIGFG